MRVSGSSEQWPKTLRLGVICLGRSGPGFEREYYLEGVALTRGSGGLGSNEASWAKTRRFASNAWTGWGKRALPEQPFGLRDYAETSVAWRLTKMQCFRERSTTRPKMITQTIRKQFFCVTDVRSTGKLLPRQLMCVIGAFAENTFIGARITQKNSCQKAMCNRCTVQFGKLIPKS